MEAMAEYLQVYRVRIPEASVPRLLEIRPAAMAEAQRLCPALVRADLVRLEGEEWLDLLVWSAPDGEAQLMARAGELEAAAEMHSLIAEVLSTHAGEVTHSTLA
jgi:hypothetical protein